MVVNHKMVSTHCGSQYSLGFFGRQVSAAQAQTHFESGYGMSSQVADRLSCGPLV